MNTLTLKITGRNTMHCSGCENTVQYMLSDLAAVEAVDANHRTQEVVVTYDAEQMSKEQMSEKAVTELADLGYQAQVA